jgi:hypothetical protein
MWGFQTHKVDLDSESLSLTRSLLLSQCHGVHGRCKVTQQHTVTQAPCRTLLLPPRQPRNGSGNCTSHQQIGVKLLAIIGFTPLLLEIIGYYCNYWLLLAVIFLQKVFILLTSSNINYCNYCDTIIAIIVSARNYLRYWQLLAIIDINLIIGIYLN